MESESLALLTDLYQLTMAYGYWTNMLYDRQASFSMFFRSNPFGGNYTIAAGLGTFLEYFRDLRFTSSDCQYLATLKDSKGGSLFDSDFLEHLRVLHFDVDVDAVPEGTLVFPNEPIVRITGSILQCQLLETALLNIVNFQSLIATKASRVKQAAGKDPVLEFGLRRAQGIDGGISASRASYIGGCDATSNVLAGKKYGIPVQGTHAHSWVMLFENELEAFRSYAGALPDNCVFLVDTYSTIEGVKNACKVGLELRAKGSEMVGIRLDSGDFVSLSIAARKILDEAGLKQAKIFASNDLDERSIVALKAAGARIDAWGIGTKLVTAYDQPALGGVYKLTAVQNAEGTWEGRLKVSEQEAKTTTPGVLNVRRRFSVTGSDSVFVEDIIYDEDHPDFSPGHDLLIPVVEAGRIAPRFLNQNLSAYRDFALQQLEHFPKSLTYPVRLEATLAERRQALIAKART